MVYIFFKHDILHSCTIWGKLFRLIFIFSNIGCKHGEYCVLIPQKRTLYTSTTRLLRVAMSPVAIERGAMLVCYA